MSTCITLETSTLLKFQLEYSYWYVKYTCMYLNTYKYFQVYLLSRASHAPCVHYVIVTIKNLIILHRKITEMFIVVLYICISFYILYWARRIYNLVRSDLTLELGNIAILSFIMILIKVP